MFTTQAAKNEYNKEESYGNICNNKTLMESAIQVCKITVT
jgi:hypothetical protein